MVLYRPDNWVPVKVAAKSSSISKYIKNKCHASLKLFKGKFEGRRQPEIASNLSSQQVVLQSLISCIKPFDKPVPKPAKTTLMEETIEAPSMDTTADYGYHSIPRINSCEINSSESKQTSCSSLLTTASSSCSSGFVDMKQDSLKSCTTLFKDELESFLVDIQCGIETYVRPSVVLKILSQSECLELFQNVEKLVPVARFLLNVINSCDVDANGCLNAESLNIVFSSFKTYMSGLSEAIEFLGYLSATNEDFILYLEKLSDDADSLKIFDFLFMPFNFVCKLIEFIKEVSNHDEHDTSINKQNLTAFVHNLYECTVVTQMSLEEKFNFHNSSTFVDSSSY